MTVLQIDYQENPNYKKGIANKLATKPLKQWGYYLEKIGQKNTPSPFLNKKWKWGLRFKVWNGIFYS
jgi:hypothetical protein